jgi:hypothetical protein
VVAAADVVGIDMGEVYIDGDKTSMHYWIPYCIFRGVYQVHRSTALAMRELPQVKVPILTIASPMDTVADPESEDIIARRSQAPWTRTYWFGTTHTPLIAPNITIYRETLNYMTAARTGSQMPDFEPSTQSIKVQNWSRLLQVGIGDSSRSRWQSDGYGSRSIGLFGNPWDGQTGAVIDNGKLGIGLWQDRLDHKLAPSFGTYLKMSLYDLPVRMTGVASVYYPFLWQCTGFAEWNVDRIRVGTRAPVGSAIQDSVVWIPEIGVSNGTVDIGVNVVVLQGVMVTVRHLFDGGMILGVAI